MSVYENIFVVIYITVPNGEIGKTIALILLEKKLCASINMVKAHSAFWWDKNIQLKGEILMLVKTKKSFFEKIIQEVGFIYPYALPAIMCVPIFPTTKYASFIEKNINGDF